MGQPDGRACQCPSLPSAEYGQVIDAEPAGDDLVRLLEDPACWTRRAAEFLLFTRERDLLAWARPSGVLLASGPLVDRLRTDPCPQVVLLATAHAGPGPGFVLGEHPELAGVVARTAVEPELLSELAGHGSAQVRAAVAANVAAPPQVLQALARDPDMGVWAVAKNNASAPSPLSIRRPTPELVAGLLAAGGAWWNVVPELVRGVDVEIACCGRPAVCLHTWGPACLEHQRVVDASRQHAGADGMLAWRGASGTWHPAAQFWDAGQVERARAGVEPVEHPAYVLVDD